MSAQIALQAVSRMNGQACLVAPTQLSDLTASLRQLYRSNHEDELAAASRAQVELLAAYGFQQSRADKSFAFSNGLAFIPVHGALINRFGQSWGYVTGYNFIRAQYNAALADDDVMGVVFDVHSFGGEAAGCFELVADLVAGREVKPSLAVVDHASYSAGYAVASAATKIAVTPSGGAGSVGVIAMHMSYAKMLDEWGLDVTLIYAGDHKADGNPFEKLPENVRKDIQASIDKSYTKFTTLVAENRGLDVQKVIDTQAQTYDADDALALGLIDVVATPAQAVAAFFNELSGSDTHQENGMSTTQASTTGAEASATATTAEQLADARKAERVRMDSIQNCEEAKDRSGLANHLALKTELSVDEAKAILAAAPIEQKAAATPAPKAAAAAADPFAAAMNSSENPNVGADGEQDGSREKMSPGSRILADYSLATGVKLQ